MLMCLMGFGGVRALVEVDFFVICWGSVIL